MSKFTALSEMGILNPEQIARFAIYTVHNTDILRIIYNRKKGSILPVSKIYKFEQLKKSTLVDSGTGTAQMIYESAPAFRSAVMELNELMDSRKSAEDYRGLIVDEIRSLEEDVASRIDYIKSLVSKI